MGSIKRFEDIKAWKKARLLVNEIYAATGNGNFAKDYSLRDQIRRAANSIMLNIAEGFARKSNNEFRQFLYISHGSAAEVQSALYIAKDQEYINDEAFSLLYEKANEISKMLSGLIKYLGQTK